MYWAVMRIEILMQYIVCKLEGILCYNIFRKTVYPLTN